MKTLQEKLGIKSSSRILVMAPPPGYLKIVGLSGAQLGSAPFDFIQLFAKDRKSLAGRLREAGGLLSKWGMVWICWRRDGEGGLDSDSVREAGLKGGLVDVKIASINGSWSGLKFVYRLKDRG